MLEAGSQAPDFTISNHKGEQVSLAAQRGKPVLLWFYPKADTPG